MVYGSPWPVIKLTYKKAVPNIFQSEANFDYAEVMVMDDINFNSFGKIRDLNCSGPVRGITNTLFKSIISSTPLSINP